LICGPVEDVDRAALVNKDFLDCVVLDLSSDDHRVVLLVVEAVKVVVREGDGRCFFLVDGLDMAEVFLSGRRGGSSTSEATRDGVDSAT